MRDPQIRLLNEFKGKTIDDDIPKKVIEIIRQNAIDTIVENLRYATKVAGLRVDFAAEDASRADFDFLVQCIRSCSPYIENFYFVIQSESSLQKRVISGLMICSNVQQALLSGYTTTMTWAWLSKILSSPLCRSDFSIGYIFRDW